MKIKYNSPVILTFAIIATLVMAITAWIDSTFASQYFAVGHSFSWQNPLSWFRLVSHCIGHGNWAHLFGNFMMILLLGPILEEKYGAAELFEMIFVTALATGILQTFLFRNELLLGASGVVFMLIILSSMSNIRAGEIPLTFVLVAILYVGAEFVSSLQADKVSQFAHILGAVCGACFGFLLERKRSFGTK